MRSLESRQTEGPSESSADKTTYDYGKCHVCGGSMVEHKVDQDFRIKGKLIVVRKIPAGVCQRCGERVVRAEVGKQLAAIVADVKSLRRAATIAVPVVAFEPGA